MRVRKGLGAALAALLAAVLCCFVTTPAYAVGVDLTRRVASKGRVRDIMASVRKPRS